MPPRVKRSTAEQQDFDHTFISVSEIRALTGAMPSTIMIARNKGRLPGGILVNGGYVWNREALWPHLRKFIEEHRKQVEVSNHVWDAANNCPTHQAPPADLHV